MRVSKQEFAERFRASLVEANRLCSDRPDAAFDQIEVVGEGVPKLDPETAVDCLFIDEDHFHWCIDVSVHPKRAGWFWVRPSAHPPVSWDKTRNATTTGPFHNVIPQ